jgi:hypothetical protein
MFTQSQAIELGTASGRRHRGKLRERMEATYKSWHAGYPAAEGVDFEQEILKLDRARLNSEPSLAKFPETKGWPDIVRAERKAFADASGCSPSESAFHYNAYYFIWTRLQGQYLGKSKSTTVGTANCTSVFIRDSKEGGPLFGRCWDVQNEPGLDLQPPRRGPDGKRRLWSKGVSCSTMCDDVPTNIFPINGWEQLPEDCRKIRDVVKFLERYVDFWGTGNGVIVDEDLDCVAFEKANCKVGWRYSENGTAAVTACAQLIPEMKAHREKCHKKSLEVRGYDNNAPDVKYWAGAEKRYHRLLKLVNEAASKPGGPAIEDMGNIVTDHAVPYPDRVCIAGESCHKDIPNDVAEWTMRCRAAVLEGPNRRTHFWRVEGKTPAYGNPPFLVPGEGVEVKPEWRKGTRPIPPAVGPDDEMEGYRQYEFDYPFLYPV